MSNSFHGNIQQSAVAAANKYMQYFLY